MLHVDIQTPDTRVWSWFTTQGPAPAARDSQVAGVHLNSMYIFGGSTGTAVNDFYELNFGEWPNFYGSPTTGAN